MGNQIAIQFKDNIKMLVEAGQLEQAKMLLEEYKKINKDDIEIFSIMGIIAMMEGDMKGAEGSFINGLSYDSSNYELLYNLAYIYENTERIEQAIDYYRRCEINCSDQQLKETIQNTVKRLKDQYKIREYDEPIEKQKIVFFVKQGMDSFIGDIINGLSYEHKVKKVTVTNYAQIDEWMEWADICWFEWCDDLVTYGSDLPLAKNKKMICRIHGYEVYGENIRKVNWENIDNLIIVAPHIRRIFEEKTQDINKENLQIDTIFCGVNVQQYPLLNKEKGFNLGYLGYINYKKNIPLTLDIFKKLHDIDNRYTLHLAGEFQDARTLSYLAYFIKEHKLENSFVFYKWLDKNEKVKWFKGIEYMVISSIDEGLCFAAAEAMCSGIKPVLHNCEGIKDHYDSKYIFNTIDEATEMVLDNNYKSQEYRKFIEERYSLENEIYKIKEIIGRYGKTKDINKKQQILDGKPLVTVGVINYNNIKYIDDCIESILNQDYPNIEILIIDDYSTDGCIEKIKGFENKQKNIKAIYHESNKGNGSYACEDIIREGKGEYFICIASDDYFPDNNVISSYIQRFKNDASIDYVYGNLVTVDEDKNQLSEWKYSQFTNIEVIEKTFKNMGSGVLTMTGMFKKNFYERNKIRWITPIDNKVAPDTYNSLILVKNNAKICHLDRNILSYRQHDTNGTLNYEERIKSIVSVIEYIIGNFNEEIYLPEIKWINLDKKLRETTKMFVLGQYYYKMMIFYYKSWAPFGRVVDLEDSKKMRYLRPLQNKIIYYLNKSIEIQDIYKKDINEIFREISLMTEKTNQNIDKRESYEI